MYMLLVSMIVVIVACSDEQRATTEGKVSGIQAIVTPVYDENGQPEYNYYSANSSVTWTADSAFEPAGAHFTRNYFEEYTWVSGSHRWDNNNNYSGADLPFGSSEPPEIQVATARMTFAVTQPNIRDVSGATVVLSSTRSEE